MNKYSRHNAVMHGVIIGATWSLAIAFVFGGQINFHVIVLFIWSLVAGGLSLYFDNRRSKSRKI